MRKTDTQKKQGAIRRKSGLVSALTYLLLSFWAGGWCCSPFTGWCSPP